MQNNNIQHLIKEAKQKLIDERILKPETINKNIESKAAHDAANYDWRYLTASMLFK
jgi:asparagine synthase (glutamine-hydrolysing)